MKFKVGDKVKVLEASMSKHLIGKTVKVISADHIVYLEKSISWWSQGTSYLELVKSAPKFKIGDTVRIIGKGIAMSAGMNRGYVGKITGMHESFWTYSSFEKKCGNYWYEIDRLPMIIEEWENGLELISPDWFGARYFALRDIRENQLIILGKDAVEFRTKYIEIDKGFFSNLKFSLHFGRSTCKVKGCSNLVKSKGKGNGYAKRCGGCINRRNRLLKSLEQA